MASFAPNDNFYWHKYDISKFAICFLKNHLRKYELKFDVKNTHIKINEWRGEYKVIYNFTVKIDGNELIVDEYLEEEDYPNFEIYSDFSAAFRLLEKTAVNMFLNNREELYKEENHDQVEESSEELFNKTYFIACSERELKNYLFEKNFISQYCTVIEFSKNKISTDFFTYENYTEQEGDLIFNKKRVGYAYEYKVESTGVSITINCSYRKGGVSRKGLAIFYADFIKKICETFKLFYRD